MQCAKVNNFKQLLAHISKSLGYHNPFYVNTNLRLKGTLPLLTNYAATVFDKMQYSAHCLNVLLPPKKATDYELRNIESSYVLSQCQLKNFKRAFVNWSLFNL